MRDRLEVDDDPAGFLFHPLSAAEVERNAVPAPVVDQQTHGDECFRVGICGNAGLVGVGGNRFAVDLSG